MTQIVEFLTARYDEEEAEAREAIAERQRVALRGDEPDYTFIASPDLGTPAVIVGPERALADIAAKRRIMARHRPATAEERSLHVGGEPACVACGDHEHAGGLEWNVEDVNDCLELRDLASVYADHSDYDESWRP